MWRFGRNDYRVMGADRMTFLTNPHPYYPLKDEHGFLDGVLVERHGRTWGCSIDQQTYPPGALLLTRQELPANARSHLDLWNGPMTDDRHVIASDAEERVHWNSGLMWVAKRFIDRSTISWGINPPGLNQQINSLS
jgi:hypothetical protein